MERGHPAVKRINDQLPPDKRGDGLDEMLLKVKTLVNLEFAHWCDLPPGRKAIPCRMLHKIKYFANGDFEKVKMRCVVRGFLQRNGLEVGATYSPSAMLQTLRLFLTIAVKFKWDIAQIDVRNAYIHGDMDREMYINVPPGVHIRDHEYEADLLAGKPPRLRALKLTKGLYGTRQGGKL